MGWNPFSKRSQEDSKSAESPRESPRDLPKDSGKIPITVPRENADKTTNAMAGAVGANVVANAGAHARETTGAAPPPGPGPSSPEPPSAQPPITRRVEELKEDVIGVLRTVFDPEIPINVYELGLVYDINVAPPGDVHIRMTLTSPACPVAGSLPPEVETKVASVPGVNAVKVELVWDPPWSPAKMSEAARLQLNI